MINIITKIMQAEYTKRISFLTGVYLKVVSINWYWQLLVNKLKISAGVIELRKEWVYQ